MKTQNSFPQFILFMGIGFGPLMLAYGMLVFGLLLNVIISVSSDPPNLRMHFAILTSFILVFSIVSLMICYRVYARYNHWRTKVAILYGFWLLLTAVPVFLLTQSVAGVSMAAVDGSIANIDLIKASLHESLTLLMLLHMGIIPWIMGAEWMMSRLKIGQSASL